MEIGKEGVRGQSRSYGDSERKQGDEDEDGGFVDCGGVAVEYH